MKKSIFGIVLVGGIVTIVACAKMIINTKKKNNIKKENKNTEDTKPTEIVIHRVGIPDEDNCEIEEDIRDDKFDEDVNSKTETCDCGTYKENIVGFRKTITRFGLAPYLKDHYKKIVEKDVCSEVQLFHIRYNIIGLYKPDDENSAIISTEITIEVEETSTDLFTDPIIKLDTRFRNGDSLEIISMIVRSCKQISDTVGDEYELVCQPIADQSHECVLHYDLRNCTIEYVSINDDVLNEKLCGVKQINQYCEI